MTSTIGVYNTHDLALKGVDQLQQAGFSEKQISVVGQVELVDDHLHVKHNEDLNMAPISVGVAAGATLGLLTGLGLFAIPGLGFLFGAGAIVGAFAGLDIGALGGAMVSVLGKVGVHNDHVVKYEEHLKSGKFLVVVQGNTDEIKHAKEVLQAHGALVEEHA
jgi:uncharacterized membrane protein